MSPSILGGLRIDDKLEFGGLHNCSNKSWACSRTTRVFENRVRATLEKRGQNSTALICGDSVETGLRSLEYGRSAIRQFGCINRLAGNDSEKPAGAFLWRHANPLASSVPFEFLASEPGN